MENLNCDLIEFIKGEILDPKAVLTEDLSIEDDLGISGEDAYEFVEIFSKKFNVNIDNFDFNEYFNSEPSFLRGMVHKKTLTIGMLDRAIYDTKL